MGRRRRGKMPWRRRMRRNELNPKMKQPLGMPAIRKHKEKRTFCLIPIFDPRCLDNNHFIHRICATTL
jgi:hypothetical protein